MKKSITALLILFVSAFVLSSCGSPYKRRKSCRGNGSWYGNRNLGSTELQNYNNQNIYRISASITD